MSSKESFEVIHTFPNPTTFQWLSGGLAASFFSTIYIIAPLLMITCAVLLTLYPFWWVTWVVCAPVFLSAVFPPFSSKAFLQSWPMKYLPAYFNYTEYREVSDAEIKSLLETKRMIFCAQPHGVFTFGGACAGIEWGKRWWDPSLAPTAVANSVMMTPLLKHVVGLFGTVDASARSLAKTLSSRSVVLYIGGIAELFLCSNQEEKLFIKERKGFVKLAMRTGVAIIPVYFFGNTSVLTVATHPILRTFARVTGVSLTIFWGSFGLPLPRPRKMTGCVGKPIDIPQIANPTEEDINKYHGIYMEEIVRLFEKFKKYNPDYEKKTLILV